MAQGSVAALQPTALASISISKMSWSTLAEDDLRQISECERIVRFRDEVLSGAHPRIKLPAHLVASKNGSDSRNAQSDSKNNTKPAMSASISPSTGLVNGSQFVDNLQSFQANAQRPAMSGNGSTATANFPGLGASFSGPSSNMSGIPTGPRAATKHFSPGTGTGQVQINPILLEKSDDLIKAEIQLQRQRLERTLREELDQHRAATKSSHATEALADFDLKDVLIKALQLVQSTATPQTDANANLAANVSGAESDSFDDNTFYSSKHDTPDSHRTHHIRSESKDEPIHDSPHYEPPMNISSMPIPAQFPVVATPSSTFMNAHATSQHQQCQPRVSTIASIHRNFTSDSMPYGRLPDNIESGRADTRGGVPMQKISSDESGEASRSGDSGPQDSQQASHQQRLEPATQQLLQQAFEEQRTSHNPMFRGHNLSPIAPQPSHVSPLATARHPPAPQSDTNMVQGTPAQVAALRNDKSNGSSPDSSLQGNKLTKKGRKEKKAAKKRKADKAPAPEPYIKPEPHSPSPVSAPQFSRPAKRARHSLPQKEVQALTYEEPRNEVVAESPLSQSYPARVHREEIAPVALGMDGYYARPESRPPRYEREYYEDRRPTETVQYVRRSSPGPYPIQYAPTETRIIRSVSRAQNERPYREAPVYYHDSREVSRMSVRPGVDRERSRSPVMHDTRPPMAPMGPPRLPASRIVLDEFGREYIEPARATSTVIRRSVAPTSVRGEPEAIYERAPASVRGEPEVIYERPSRAESVMPGPDRYEEGGVVYRRAASPMYAPRRVVTQPEYAYPEYRSYRQREYSVRPAGQPGEDYVEMGGPPDRRLVEEIPREYITRATTVRPVETVRYETREYGTRLSSIRPEQIPGGEYAQFAPPPRSYSVRPMDPPPSQVVRRGYSVRPVELEYYERPVMGEEAPYADRDVVYAGQNPAPRDVYR